MSLATQKFQAKGGHLKQKTRVRLSDGSSDACDAAFLHVELEETL